MNTAALEKTRPLESNLEQTWETVCDAIDLLPNLGVRALVAGKQVALFRVQGLVYAIEAIDPLSQAAVLARGIVGDLGDRIVVASPLYKQHFDLVTGQCLEDERVRVLTFAARELKGKIQVAV